MLNFSTKFKPKSGMHQQRLS